MDAKYILAGLACTFGVAGAIRLAREGGKAKPQSKTWLLMSAIFALVSAWLFYNG